MPTIYFLKRPLISKLHTVMYWESYIIPARVTYFDGKSDEIKIIIESLGIMYSVVDYHNLSEIFTQLLRMWGENKHNKVEIRFELPRVEKYAIDMQLDCKWIPTLSKALSKLSYMLYHLGIPVNQVMYDHYEECAYSGEKRRSKDYIDSIQIHLVAVLQLFPEYNGCKPVTLTPLQTLCMKYLMHEIPKPCLAG